MGAVGPVNGVVGPWIMVMSAFKCHLIVDGTCSTFSLHSADISNLEGPFATALSEVIGFGQTSIIKGIVGSIGFFWRPRPQIFIFSWEIFGMLCRAVDLRIRQTRRSNNVEEEAIEGKQNGLRLCTLYFRCRLLRRKHLALQAAGSVFGMLGYYVPFNLMNDVAVSKHRCKFSVLPILRDGFGKHSRPFISRLYGRYPENRRPPDNHHFHCAEWGIHPQFTGCGWLYCNGDTLWPLWPCSRHNYHACFQNLFGKDLLTKSYGIISISRDLGAIVGKPIADILHKYTGSYDIPLYAAGGFLTLLMLFYLLSFKIFFIGKPSALFMIILHVPLCPSIFVALVSSF